MKFKNSAFILGFQVLTTLLQLIYGAVSSRMVDPLQFGYYATCLALSAVSAMAFSSGYTEDVILNYEDENKSLNEVFSKALISGLLGFLFTVLVGILLFELWKIPVNLALTTALIVMFTSAQNVILGVFSRERHFIKSALLAFVCSLVGFIFATFAIFVDPSANSLLISPLVALLSFVAAGGFFYRDTLFPIKKPEFKYFSAKGFKSNILIYRVLWFLNSNITRWSLIGNGFHNSLGQLNRSEVVSSVPLQQVQAALNKPFYPKASRNSKESIEISFPFTKALGSLIFLGSVFLTIGALCVREIAVLFLGGKWGSAAEVAVLLLIIGIFQIPTVIMSTVIETRALFRGTYIVESCILLFQLIFLVVLAGQDNLTVIVFLMLYSMILRFVAYLILLLMARLLHLRALLGWILLSSFASIVIIICVNLLTDVIYMFGFSQTIANLSSAILTAIALLFFIANTKFGKKTLSYFAWLISE